VDGWSRPTPRARIRTSGPTNAPHASRTQTRGRAVLSTCAPAADRHAHIAEAIKPRGSVAGRPSSLQLQARRRCRPAAEQIERGPNIGAADGSYRSFLQRLLAARSGLSAAAPSMATTARISSSASNAASRTSA
jgi:hypothetical protein